MSSKVVLAGSPDSREPPSEPALDTTNPASASSFNMRRMTTGLVLTLSATCSDLRGSSPDQAIKLSTCTATANLLFVDISNTWDYGPPFCNHYSYKFDFVKSIVLGELRRFSHKKAPEAQMNSSNGSALVL